MSVQNYDGATIEVLKWDEYNPRMDSKKPHWFRLENDLATSGSFFDLDCEQKWLWIVILSLVSKKNGQPILWNAAFIYGLTKIKPTKQFQTIEIFEKFARLRVSRNVTLRDSPATRRDETRRDETGICNLDFLDQQIQDKSPPVGKEFPLLARLWNEHCGTLPKVVSASPKRKKKIAAAMEENPDPSYWTSVIKKISKSSFCNGKTKDRWRASFDWLLKDDVHTRVFEGNFDDGDTESKTNQIPDIWSAKWKKRVEQGEPTV